MERPGCDLNSLRFESEHSLRIPCDAPNAPGMRFVGRYVLQRICLGVFWDAPHNLNRITEAQVDRGSGRKAEKIGCPFCELGIQAGSIMGLDTQTSGAKSQAWGRVSQRRLNNGKVHAPSIRCYIPFLVCQVMSTRHPQRESSVSRQESRSESQSRV